MAQVPRGPPPGFAARPPPPGFEHRIPARTVSSEAYTAATTVPPPAPVVTSTSRSRSEPQSGLANAHLAAARGNEPPVPQARPPRDHHKRQSSGCEPRSSPAAARRQRSADGNAAASVASASRLDSVMSTSTVEAPTCLVCCDDLAYLAVGKCNHGICHVCSLRSRVLCNSNSCPVCRADLKQILISQDINAVYEKVSKKQLLFDRRHRAYFSSTEAQQEVNKLFEFRCPDCGSVEKNMQQLTRHASKEHEKFYCELCVDNMKMFPFEHQLYGRKELGTHKRKTHTYCEFCDHRYFDDDALLEHLLAQHQRCEICKQLGLYSVFFAAYSQLESHLRREHILCDKCVDESGRRFRAFSTDIDFRAHVAAEHTGSRGEARQIRNISAEVFGPDPAAAAHRGAVGGGREGVGGGRGRGHAAPPREPRAEAPVSRQPRDVPADLFSGPTLSGNPAPVPAAPPPPPVDHFPILGARPVGIGGSSGGGGAAPSAPLNFSSVMGGRGFIPQTTVGNAASGTSTASWSTRARPAPGTREAVMPAQQHFVPHASSKMGDFAPPAKFRERNTALMETLRLTLGPRMVEFKAASAAFRHGRTTAVDYLEQCIQLFGPAMPELFSELVALLPDIELQQALFQAAVKSRQPPPDRLGVPRLTVCSQCQQVVVYQDRVLHEQGHGPLQTQDFPSLPLGNSSGRRPIVAHRPVKQPRASAWVRH